MSENVITIRAEIKEAEESLDRLYKKLDGLRDAASKSGKGIDQEMRRAASGIVEYKGKIAEADKELLSINNSLREHGNRLKSQKIAVNQYSSAVEKLNSAISTASAGERATLATLRETATSYDELQSKVNALRANKVGYRTEIINLRQRLVELNQVQQQTADTTTQMSDRYSGLAKVMRQTAGVFGYGLGIYGAVRALRESVKIIAEFEKGQKQLAAVTSATSSQMDAFSRSAILIGSSSIFGAKGVSDLQVQLAKMGFTIQEINQMTQGIVNLAIATQEDLPKAAETVANILRAYNMSATETQRVVDAMAKSFTASALDLERFRQSIKYIAPIAAQANFTIEETASLLGKLADAGIYGSLAGTSLRNVISQLSDSTSNLAKKVGMTISGFDDFVTALWTLNEQGTDLEDVFDIMDRRAASAFTIIMRGVDSLDEFRRALEDSGGAADRMAKVQMESLAYKTEMAKRAWEGFVLSLDKGDSMLSEMLKKTLSVFSNTLGGITEEMSGQAKIIQNQLREYDVLTRGVMDTNRAYDTRLLLFKELQDKYPEHLGKLRDEIIETEELAQVLGKLRDEIERPLEYAMISAEVKRVERDLQTTIDKIVEMQEVQERFDIGKIFVQGTMMPAFEPTIDALKLLSTAFRYIRFQGDGVIDVMGKLESAAENYRTGLVQLKLDQDKIKWSTLTPEEIAEQQDISDYIALVVEGLKESSAHWQELGIKIPDANDAAIQGLMRMNKVQEETLQLEIDRLKVIMDSGELTQSQHYQHMSLWKEKTAALINYKKWEQTAIDLFREHADKEKKENLERINQEEQLAILRAKTTNEGIALEKKLSDIQYQFAMRRAELVQGDDRKHQEDAAWLEKKIGLQKIDIAQIEKRFQLYLKEQASMQRMSQLYSNLIQEQIKGQQIMLSREDVDERFKLEEEIAREALNQQKWSIKEQAKARVAAARIEADKRIADFERNGELKAEINREFRDEEARINAEGNAEIELAEEIHQARLIEIASNRVMAVKDLEETLSGERMAQFDHLQRLEQIEFLSRRRRGLELRDFERKQHEEKLKEKEKEIQIQIELLELELLAAQKEDSEVSTKAIENMVLALRGLRRALAEVQQELKFPKFDEGEWKTYTQAIKFAADQIRNTLTKLSRDKADFYRRERELLDRHVDEMARAVDTEIKLNEAGFASNVGLMRKQHEEAKRLRREALIAEERAAEQLRRTEAIVQSVQLASTAVNLMKDATKKLGLLGIPVAIGAIAGMFGLWSNVKQKSKAATRLREGGSFILDGERHSNGGTMLTPRHEAEKGEGVTVWNRQVTRKNWPQIKRLSDLINHGKPMQSNVNVFANNKDLSAMRRIMENEEKIYYEGGRRITKRGDYTYICHLN